jgi:hypothetical protein
MSGFQGGSVDSADLRNVHGAIIQNTTSFTNMRFDVLTAVKMSILDFCVDFQG